MSALVSNKSKSAILSIPRLNLGWLKNHPTIMSALENKIKIFHNYSEILTTMAKYGVRFRLDQN